MSVYDHPTTLPAPLAVDEREAARLLGLSPRKVHSLRKAGELPYRQVGRRVLITVKSIHEFLEAEPAIRD